MFEIKYNKILIPVDFSDPARKAFYTGIRLASHFEADTFILHVTERLHTFDSDFDEMEKLSSDVTRLEQGVRRRLDSLFEEGGVAEHDRRRVQVEIRGGKPWMEIAKFASEKDVDLIVMATHGYTGLKHMFVGSTAERVVRHAPCQVLCVKPDDFDAKIEKLLGDFID
jgi:nucleotide-binding universal stress UspA family protein